MSCLGSWEDLLQSLCFSAKVSSSDDDAAFLKMKDSDNKLRGEIVLGSSSAVVSNDDNNSSKDTKQFLLRRKKRRLLRFSFPRSSKVDASFTNEKPAKNAAIEDLNGIAAANEIELGRRFPESTLNERKRFLTMRSLPKATEKMSYYMKWRRQYHLDSPSFRDHAIFGSDLDSWKFAVIHASRHFQDGSLKSIQTLPRIVKFGDESGLYTRDRKRIAHVLPGLIDKDIAPLEFYALCVAIYMDLKFDRNSDENIYVFIDVRAGVNWPNPSPSSLVPFVKNLTKNLSDTMPERMCKTIVYPIPSYAKPVWVIYKQFLEPRQVQKIDVLWGPASVDSYIPIEMSRQSFCGTDLLEKLEQSRLREFYPDVLQ